MQIFVKPDRVEQAQRTSRAGWGKSLAFLTLILDALKGVAAILIVD